MEHRNSTRTAAWAAVTGGAVWALTPLRDQLVGGGGDPADGATFQLYNAVVVAAALLLSLALVHLLRQATPRRRAVTVSAAVVLLGHALSVAGSVPAVLLGSAAGDLVRAGQDLGFLGALLAAAAAVPLGIVGARRSVLPKSCAVLLALALPGGVLGAVLLAALGAPPDLLGLPLTLLYGGAYVAFGHALLSTRTTDPAKARLLH